jgi:hypothetical protein
VGVWAKTPDLAGLVRFLLFPFNQFYPLARIVRFMPLTEIFLALKKELHLIVQ